LWKLQAPTPPRYDSTISSHGSSFINCVAYVPPTADFSQGLVISGARDGIIEARQPTKTADDNAEALLLGHSNNVCALDVSPNGSFIVSGSWDTDARVWQVGKWETAAILAGHEAAVWTVLAYSNDLVITGKFIFDV
jgi:phospholipase A-2-activating protein